MSNLIIKFIILCSFTLNVYANITSLSPQKDAADVSPDIKVQITYDNPIVTSSINKNTIQLKTDNKKINGKASVKDKNTLVFTPNENLKTGIYSLHVKSIKLNNPEPIKPKTRYQKLVFKFCSFFYSDVKKCKLYQRLFGNNDIKTKSISYSFSVNDNIPTIETLSLKATQIELKENSEANLTLKATYSDNTTKEITENINWTIQDNTIVSIDNNTLKALKEGTTTLSATVDNQTSNTISITVYKEKLPIVELLSPINHVKYAYVTLEVNATNTKQIRAINRTLIADENKTIFVQGVKNENKFYFYNVPLTKGVNTIELNATGDTLNALQNIDVTSDANGSAPIVMRAEEHEGIHNLQTTVQTATLLDASEYLFDNDGNGVIDEISTDGNFSVNLNKEGRYKPRVTIRTKDNILYSSGDFGLSLDVKADANQYDPKGAQPVDVAKEFVQALIDNDRASVEHLLGNNQKYIKYIYEDSARLLGAITYYKHIVRWEQTYHNSSHATVKIYTDDGTEQADGGFEMVLADQQIKTGRYWLIRTFY